MRKVMRKFLEFGPPSRAFSSAPLCYVAELVRRRRLIALILLVAGYQDARADPEGRKDALGDPLPKGALKRLGTRRLRHEDNVYAVSFSPDGSVLASCSADQSIRLWDPKSGREIRRFGHTDAVFSLAFFADGKRLITVGRDDRVRLGDVEKGTERAQWEVLCGSEGAVAASPDGNFVAAAGEGGTLLLMRLDGDSVRETTTVSVVETRSIAFSPDGRLLAVAGQPGRLDLIDVASARVVQTLAGHEQGIYKVAFSPDGRSVVSSGRDARVCLWDLRTGKEVRHFDGCDFVADGVCFSPDGSRVAAADYWGNVFVWEPDTGKTTCRFTGESEWVMDLAFAPDGKTLAAGSYDIRLFDLDTGRPRCAFDGHREEVRALAFSPDGTTIASGGGHSAVHLWSVETGAVQRRIPYRNHGIDSLAFSPDAKRLAAAVSLFQLLVLSIVQRRFFDEVLGIHDPRDGRLTFVGGDRSASYLRRRVDSGEFAYAVTLPPVTMEQFIEVCRQGRFMPPKSTWFQPKVLTGLVTALARAPSRGFQLHGRLMRKS